MPGSRRKKGLQRGSGQLGQTQKVMEFRSPDPEEVETQIIATVEPGGYSFHPTLSAGEETNAQKH